MPVKKIDKQEIIEIAYQIFRTKGYANTSIADIATACGTFKSGLYHYFSNKEELLAEVLRWVHSLAKNDSFKTLRNTEIPEKDRLKKLLKTLRRIHIEEQGGCIFGNISLETASQNEVFRKIIRVYFEDYIQAFEVLFQNRYSKKEARTIAIQCVEKIEGSLMLARIYQDSSLITAAHKEISEYLN